MQKLQEDVKSNVFRLYHVAVIKQNFQTRLFSKWHEIELERNLIQNRLSGNENKDLIEIQ